MGIRIPDLLAGILDATAAKTHAEARIAGLRAALERVAVDRLTNDGAAPTWKAPAAGTVRYDPPGAWAATVIDPDQFGSFVAEHYPSEATAVLRLPADQLEPALEALGFAGIKPEETPRIEVRDAWAKAYLAGVTVDVEEDVDDEGAVLSRTFTIVDAKGLLTDGVAGTRSNGKLVVSLDPARKASAVEEALEAAKATVAAAVGVDAPAPADKVAAREGRTVTIDELVGAGLVKPASELARPPAPELSEEEAATVARFDRLPDAVEADRHAGAIAASYAAEDPYAVLDDPTSTAVPTPEDVALAVDAITAIEDLDNREALRRIAKARNVSAAGTKRELAERLYADGFRA